MANNIKRALAFAALDELEERYTKRCQAGDFKTANALVGIRAPAD